MTGKTTISVVAVKNRKRTYLDDAPSRCCRQD